MLSRDARLYRESLHAATLTIAFICLSSVCSNLGTNVFLPFFFPFSILSCICTNVIYTSDAPKLFCGCQQPSTLRCVCVRGNSPISLCVMYINVAVYGIYVKPEECWYMNEIRARFPQSFLVVRCSSLLCMPVNKETFAEKLSGKRAVLTCETSQCYCFSCLYDASVGWCDHSGALYC